jgi:hypothetical protein
MPRSALPGLKPILVLLFAFPLFHRCVSESVTQGRLCRISLRTAPQLWMVIYHDKAQTVIGLRFPLNR